MDVPLRISLEMPLGVPPKVHPVFSLEILLTVPDFCWKVLIQIFSGIPTRTSALLHSIPG